MTDDGKIITRIDGPIGTLTIDYQQRRNALTFAMWQSIPGGMARLIDDPTVRVIVITGAGDKAFAAGADISQFEQQRATTGQGEAYADAVSGACDAIEQSPKPTIARIRGVCYGGGTGLALSCDLRIAADDARLAITAAKLGIGYPYEGLRRLALLVGPSAAKEFMFTAEPWTAEEALARRLVNRVVPAAKLEAFVADYAGKIAGNAPLTLAAAKRCIDASMTLTPDVVACRDAVAACAASADYIEGRRAFVEKRKPVFRGV